MRRYKPLKSSLLVVICFMLQNLVIMPLLPNQALYADEVDMRDGQGERRGDTRGARRTWMWGGGRPRCNVGDRGEANGSKQAKRDDEQ